MADDKNIQVTFDTKKLEQAIAIVPGRIYSELKKGFREVGDNFLRTMRLERLTKHSDTSLGVRTGDLRRSFNKEINGGEINNLTLFVYTTSKYARIHEQGGTIYPKNSKYLAIPLSGAKTASGASRYKSPRDVPDLRYGGRSARGNIILRTVDGVPMFVLVNSVTIKPRLNMFNTWNRDIPLAMSILNNSVDRALKEN